MVQPRAIPLPLDWRPATTQRQLCIVRGGRDLFHLLLDGFKGIKLIGDIGWCSQAYFQQLESSRIKLTQLEQELQRARAQIGNWSRWLTNMFRMDVDDSLKEDQIDGGDGDGKGIDAEFKSFRPLNTLSDLLMLPKDMLIDRPIRK